MGPKQRAAEAALTHVCSGMVVGLGTGSTADCFLSALSAALCQGRLRDVRGIATSRQSENRARELNIPLLSPADARPDVTIDGADEIAPNLDLIKGMGGALLREKIVAQNSRRLLIIADSSKLVAVLGTRSPLPVEVATFGHSLHVPFLSDLGATPRLRVNADGSPFLTDNGNYIYDCRFSRIDDPASLQQTLRTRAGIVDCGLFLGMASIAIVGDQQGVREIHAP